jgi:stearoyl-CoA desaturase (Delta-9 desaturase)
VSPSPLSSSTVPSSAAGKHRLANLKLSLIRWIDSDYGAEDPQTVRAKPDRVELLRCLPFAFLHLGCFGVIWTGWSPFAVALAVGLYLVRMFAITGFYHRYFSHRTFRTSRPAQFLFALLGASSAQRGPLWWAYQHRHHHRHSDEEPDVHSPVQHGFVWSHIGWITSGRNFPTDYSQVRDLAKYPELVFLNRFDIVAPLVLAASCYGAGALLGAFAPGLGVTGAQLLVWGFFISTTFLFHATSSINSLAHTFGRKRFKTDDESRNSFLLAIITLGEGWHNNHHRHMNSTRQGFYWWEFDPTYYALKALSWTGLIWDLRPVPEEVYAEAEARSEQKLASQP